MLEYKELLVGVIGGGSFGMVIVNLLVYNCDVVFYVWNVKVVE